MVYLFSLSVLSFAARNEGTRASSQQLYLRNLALCVSHHPFLSSTRMLHIPLSSLVFLTSFRRPCPSSSSVRPLVLFSSLTVLFACHRTLGFSSFFLTSLSLSLILHAEPFLVLPSSNCPFFSLFEPSSQWIPIHHYHIRVNTHKVPIYVHAHVLQGVDTRRDTRVYTPTCASRAATLPPGQIRTAREADVCLWCMYKMFFRGEETLSLNQDSTGASCKEDNETKEERNVGRLFSL